jgi:hypothetical protein
VRRTQRSADERSSNDYADQHTNWSSHRPPDSKQIWRQKQQTPACERHRMSGGRDVWEALRAQPRCSQPRETREMRTRLRAACRT